ncbi:SGS domain-containing protein [Bombardia bombarda]|uniref:SGS domain-containing protein n=1 Tax=Bombardia bombarda TaxID=252184 RepID=A0AA40CG38_9PEZI|nr:SGS domain-containing protein [Bombardia bombarda]
MSATTLAHRGIEAVRNKDYAAAIPLLDQAIEQTNSPFWLLARANAHQQLKHYDAALHDAGLAYHTAAERGSGTSRKHMIEAQYRRATIYFKLGRYADSDCCAKWSMLLAEGRPAREDDGVEKKVDAKGYYTVTLEEGIADKLNQPGGGPASIMAGSVSGSGTGFEADWNRAYAWRSQTLGTLKGLPADDPARKVAVAKIPSKPKPKKAEVREVDPDVEEALAAQKAAEADGPASGWVPEKKLKLRSDFYQSNTHVAVSLFGKGIKKEELKVEFSDKQVQIGPIPREVAPYVKPGDRESTSTLFLGGEIVPSGSRWSATTRKIELVLRKATPGVKWSTWGEEKIGSVAFSEAAESAKANKQPAAAAQAAAAAASAPSIVADAHVPAYPTSSKTGPKDWDKLEDGEEDDQEKQDVNFFFKQLYKGAAPEQQRAMMKSFTESNGTALSTDWNDVKARKVETLPPDGVEVKKWD